MRDAEDRVAFTRKTADKTNRYVGVNIIRDLLLIQPRYPVSVALDPGQLNIRFEILFDRLHSWFPGFGFSPRAQPLRAIRDIFHRDVKFPSGRRNGIAFGERGTSPIDIYTDFRAAGTIYSHELCKRSNKTDPIAILKLTIHAHPLRDRMKNKAKYFYRNSRNMVEVKVESLFGLIFTMALVQKKYILVYTVRHTSSVASLARYRDDGMRTARRGWRPKNFLDARSSPKKFTVRKALRVYGHSVRRREDTYLVLPLALSTVFSPTSFLLPQQQSLSSFCRFLLSTICAIWGVLGFAFASSPAVTFFHGYTSASGSLRSSHSLSLPPFFHCPYSPRPFAPLSPAG